MSSTIGPPNSNKPVFALIDGRIIRRDEHVIVVEIYSGSQFEITTEGVNEVREYQDPMTKQAMVQILVGEEGSLTLTSKIQPRLARLAQEALVLPVGLEYLAAFKPAKVASARPSDQPTRCVENTTTWCTPYAPAAIPDDTQGDIGHIDD